MKQTRFEQGMEQLGKIDGVGGEAVIRSLLTSADTLSSLRSEKSIPAQACPYRNGSLSQLQAC